MPGEENEIRISAEKMQDVFKNILLHHGMADEKAGICAKVFTANSLDGVYSHGVNRFAVFVKYIRQGFVKVDAEPILKHAFGSLQQWDGNLGPGILNAISASEKAMQLAELSGIGCVTLSNTNHWMRAGYYGWQAAKKGYVLICWTNTIANMPAWGAKDARLGNNPLMMAVPYGDEAIVLDMAMSQYSFGAMEQAAQSGKKLSQAGGYDVDGKLVDDPAAIIKSRRPISIGYWKGAGVSLLLDILATVLSGGLSTQEISKQKSEYGVSQVFIAIAINKLHNSSSIRKVVQDIISDYHASEKMDNSSGIVYPGESILASRVQNIKTGIPVNKKVWDAILQLQEA